MSVRHILWVNELACLTGGSEYYVYNTVRLLKARGVCATLLYDAIRGQAAPDMIQAFDHAFPMVDLPRQVKDIAPDLIYVHRLSRLDAVRDLTAANIPSVRFFHDHKPFCPREHKYTTFTHTTCTQPIGWRCYPCLGFLNRGSGPLGLRLSTVASLRREHRANASFDAFVAGSPYMAEHLAAHGFDPAKVHVVPLFSLPPAEGTPIEREHDLFLFVGQLLRGKGLDVLLRAMTLVHRPVRLLVAGAGRQEGLFRGLCDTFGLNDRVTFLGKVAQDDLDAYFRRAACVVLPARQPETFGLIGPEAMSRGTPVIATAVGGIPTWLDDGRTGLLIPPNAPQALADAIDKIAGDPSLAETLGAGAKARYEAEFRPEQHVQLLMSLFDSLASGRP